MLLESWKTHVYVYDLSARLNLSSKISKVQAGTSQPKVSRQDRGDYVFLAHCVR